ncbi:MAG: ECF transporter S component [Oscillospiraceae bacterium]|nr:ECF transporter S component [Oscillospiraceae bacterium]
MSTAKIKSRTLKMAEMSMLTAIILILGLIPPGYIQIGVMKLTLLQIPVAVGAIMIGPLAGLFLGGVFGLTSFIQCLGMDAFGVAMLALNPFYTVVLCMVPRLLMGWLTGMVFYGLKRYERFRIISGGVTCLSGAVFNTVFFMSALMLLFGRGTVIDVLTPLYDGHVPSGLLNAENIIIFCAVFIGVNAVIEAIVCTVLGSAIAPALMKAHKRLNDES